MIAIFEKRLQSADLAVWAGKFRNLKNAPHWHDENELVCCQTGLLRISLEDRQIELSEGESAFLSGGRIHAIESAPGSVATTVLASRELLHELTDRAVPASVRLTTAVDLTSFSETYRREIGKHTPLSAFCLNHAAALLFGQIFSAEPLIPVPPQVQNAPHAIVREAVREIEINYREADFHTVCNHSGYSPSHFSRLFSALTGLTFTRYLAAYRVEQAIRMIRSGHSTMTRISDACGFASVRNFNRDFRKLTGFSPSTLPPDYEFRMYRLQARSLAADPTEKTSEPLAL